MRVFKKNRPHSIECRARFALLLQDEPHFKKAAIDNAEFDAEFEQLKKMKNNNTFALVQELQALGRIPRKVRPTSESKRREPVFA